MSQNNTQTTAAYNLPGTIHQVVHASDRNGRPYARMRFAFVAQGRTQERTAMAFGKAYDAVKNSLVEGAAIRLYGKFESGTFAVIGLGPPPRTPIATDQAELPLSQPQDRIEPEQTAQLTETPQPENVPAKKIRRKAEKAVTDTPRRRKVA